jgi:excisionase family DNA binding protein
MVDSRYYTPQEVAEILGTDDEQILAWIHSGELVAINVAKSVSGKRPRWRVPETALGKMLIGRMHPASMQQAVASKPRQHKPKQYV